MTTSKDDTVVFDALRGIDEFEDLSEEHLQQIAQYTVCENLDENYVVFREGDVSKYIYFINKGYVALEVQVPGHVAKRIHTVSAGELLGWSPVLGESRMTATARTLTPTYACRIDAKQALAFCELNPRFGYEFMTRAARAIAKRLTATRLQLLDVYRHELPQVTGEEGERVT